MGQNIEITAKTGLCVSCGLCKAVCPKESISYEEQNGLYIPSVNSDCIKCGLCLKVCPGINRGYKQTAEPIEAVYGDYLSVYNAWSKNPTLRHVSASGGTVSTIISNLLKKKLYDEAFVVDDYSYKEQIHCKAISAENLDDNWEQSSYPKSRYLSVSHENAVRYIQENKDNRVIFVGAPCAITGLQRVVRLLKREPSQYLFIGLFCDSVFNYQVLDYFTDRFGKGKKIEKLHFKNKESGGWPGNMKAFYDDGQYEYIDKSERANAKKYFMPEACLYCIDKLNVNADISVGDNYTDQNSSELGSNSVIIRTAAGMAAWESASDDLDYESVDITKLRKAQYLDGRLNNLFFAMLKEREVKQKYTYSISLHEGIQKDVKLVDYEQAWKGALRKIRLGANYRNNPQGINTQPSRIETLGNRLYYAVKRRIVKR